MTFPEAFQKTLDFHGHLCLDIAMGYRAAQAALAMLGTDAADPKALVTITENDTCAVDAFQRLCGCTFGKRNLIPRITGKPVYTVQNTRTGNGARVYVKFWETFDLNGDFRARMRKASGGTLPPDKAKAFQAEHDALIQHILSAPEAELFNITRATTPPPAKSGGFEAAPCAMCGEFVKMALLVDGRCGDCRN